MSVMQINATIAINTSLSGAIRLTGVTSNDGATVPRDYRLCGIVMPATWTTANLTFQTSVDGVTYQNFYDAAGTEVAVVAAASRTIYLDPAIFAAVPYLKVRSGTSGTAVNQAAARTIGLILRAV